MDRIVLITGASSGLGLALAERFVKAGDKVFGVSRTKRSWVEARRRIPDKDSFLLDQVDVTSAPEVKRYLSGIKKKAGRIDVLINNAGYANRPVRTERETLREFQMNFSYNLVSTFLMCKHALPVFLHQKKGWILNISSMAGKRAVPFLAAYSASKSGVIALTQTIVKENPEAGFRCITVCPGGMNTAMRARLFGRKDALRQQSPDFVAEKILEILSGKISVPSGGDIIIRHNRIQAINPPPEP